MGLLRQPAAPPRQALAAALAIVILWLAPGGGPRAGENPLETAIKASYLYKFAPFVDWPPKVFAAAEAPFTICVVGRDPFGPVLDRAVKGQQVAGHPIVVTRLATASADAACQIAFLGGSRAQPVKDALRALRGAPVLTVTDGPEAPGVIDFAIADDRVRFRIDDEAAAEDGLAISSKLLSLALAVNPRRPAGPPP